MASGMRGDHHRPSEVLDGVQMFRKTTPPGRRTLRSNPSLLPSLTDGAADQTEESCGREGSAGGPLYLAEAAARQVAVEPLALSPAVSPATTPLTGLDEERRGRVREAVERLSQGRTTRLVTHDAHEAASCDHIWLQGCVLRSLLVARFRLCDHIWLP